MQLQGAARQVFSFEKSTVTICKCLSSARSICPPLTFTPTILERHCGHCRASLTIVLSLTCCPQALLSTQPSFWLWSPCSQLPLWSPGPDALCGPRVCPACCPLPCSPGEGPRLHPSPRPGPRHQRTSGVKGLGFQKVPSQGERSEEGQKEGPFANLCLGQTAEAHICPVDLEGRRSLARRGFGRRCPCTHAGMAGQKRRAV